MKVCLHWREEFKAGPYTLLISSYNALNSKFTQPQSKQEPDFGIYLDEYWESVTTSYPKIIVKWPDTGVIELPELKQLVQKIKSLSSQGKVIDIACIMGHGRTGTLLACLLVDLEGMNAVQAIASVRNRHCEYAVEYAEQERLVALYAKDVHKIS